MRQIFFSCKWSVLSLDLGLGVFECGVLLLLLREIIVLFACIQAVVRDHRDANGSHVSNMGRGKAVL